MVLETNLEPFREPLKVPPVGQPKNPFSKSVLSKSESTEWSLVWRWSLQNEWITQMFTPNSL